MGMLFQTMYNVVDTWAAGKLSTEALAALSASFPVFFLIIAVASGCQAAANALVSHALGRQDEGAVEELAGQALFFAVWLSILFGVFGWWSAPHAFRLLGVEGESFDLALSYMRMIFWSTPFFVLGSTLNGLLSAHGDTRPFRNSLFIGMLLNIVLDLWFVFGGYGLPALGFPGIALSTMLIQMFSFFYMLWKAIQAGILPAKGITHLKPRMHVQRQLMGQGVPAMVNMLTIAAGIFVYTAFAAGISNEVLAAMGIAMRIEQMALLPGIGLNTAAMTLAGHSYGAGRLDRLRETLFTCLKIGLILWALGAAVVLLPGNFWMELFSDDLRVIQCGRQNLQIAMLSFYSYIILFTATSILQGLQRPMFAIWLGLYRQLLAPMLLIPVLMQRNDPPELGIWWGAFVSSWSGALITLVYLGWVWRRLRKELPAQSSNKPST